MQSNYVSPTRCSEGPPLCSGPNACIYLALGNIDTDDNQIVLCHHPLPSLPGTGSKPLQLFGLRKTPELSLALITGSVAFGRNGLSSGNGRLVEPPVVTFWQIFKIQGRSRSQRVGAKRRPMINSAKASGEGRGSAVNPIDGLSGSCSVSLQPFDPIVFFIWRAQCLAPHPPRIWRCAPTSPRARAGRGLRGASLQISIKRFKQPRAPRSRAAARVGLLGDLPFLRGDGAPNDAPW